MKIASLFVVLLASLVLVACGGNDANTAGTNSGSGSACTGGPKEPEKPPTPEELRKEVVKKMVAAMVALDGEAVKNLFHKDEHANAEKRITREFQEMKDKGVKVKAEEPTFEEKEGKFFVTFPHTLTEGENVKNEKPTLSMIEKDGKWWLSFQR